MKMRGWGAWSIATCLSCCLGAAEPTVVISKAQKIEPGALPVGLDSVASRFLEAVRKAQGTPFDGKVELVNPPAWGKVIAPNTAGTLAFHTSFQGGFRFHVSLANLRPNQHCSLTLNGKPGLEGNELLLDPVPGLEAERYYDFFKFDTDANGCFEKDLAVALKPGPYRARFYVKDTDDYKIILYHDYFPFQVK